MGPVKNEHGGMSLLDGGILGRKGGGAVKGWAKS